jgi:hypothetical protein
LSHDQTNGGPNQQWLPVSTSIINFWTIYGHVHNFYNW